MLRVILSTAAAFALGVTSMATAQPQKSQQRASSSAEQAQQIPNAKLRLQNITAQLLGENVELAERVDVLTFQLQNSQRHIEELRAQLKKASPTEEPKK